MNYFSKKKKRLIYVIECQIILDWLLVNFIFAAVTQLGKMGPQNLFVNEKSKKPPQDEEFFEGVRYMTQGGKFL
jgi:hypothetical protein